MSAVRTICEACGHLGPWREVDDARAPLEIPQATRERIEQLKVIEDKAQGLAVRHMADAMRLATEQTLRECGYTI
jgi:hypothetical protein